MRSILYIFCYILLGHYSLAQECQSEEYVQIKHLLSEHNLAYFPKENIKLADSITLVLEKKDQLDCDLYWNALFYKGEAQVQLAEFAEAMYTFHQTIDLAERYFDYSIVARSYLFLALIHEVAGRKLDCVHNLDKAIQIINEHNLYALYAWYCVRYSSYQRFHGDRDTAEKYAQLATIAGREVGDIRNELDGHMLLGILSRDVEASIRNFERSSDLYIEQKAFSGASFQTFNIVNRLLNDNQLDRAQVYLDKAYSYLDQAEEKNMDYYQTLARFFELKKEVFSKQGSLDSALEYANRYILNLENTQFFIDQGAINEAEIKFAVEREQLRTSELEESSRRLKIGMSIGAFILLLLGGLLGMIVRSRKKISKQNQLIRSRNSALNESITKNEMLLSEVHHRVKNNLQNIISLIFFKEVNTNDTNAKEGLQDISSKIRSIALIHEQLYRNNEFEYIDIKVYFQELMSHFKDISKGGLMPLNFEIDAENISLNLETAIPLGIAFSELMNNSIKHSKAQIALHISISMHKNDEGLFTFIFKDNGDGYKEGFEEEPGLGLSLIRNMTRQLRGNLELSNHGGALASITFHQKVISKI